MPRVRDHTRNPAEYTGVTKIGRQLGPGAREQRARKAKRTLARRRAITRAGQLVGVVGVVVALAGWSRHQPAGLALGFLLALAGVLVVVNTPTRRRKRGRR